MRSRPAVRLSRIRRLRRSPPFNARQPVIEATRAAAVGERRHAKIAAPMVTSDVVLGRNVRVFQPDLVNLYGCVIGDDSRVGAFVEVQKGASIGARCKISSHTFICTGVSIEDDVFVGHGVMFINDIYPGAVNADGSPQSEADWQVIETHIGRGASLGSKLHYHGRYTGGRVRSGGRRSGGDQGRSRVCHCGGRARASDRRRPYAAQGRRERNGWRRGG